MVCPTEYLVIHMSKSYYLDHRLLICRLAPSSDFVFFAFNVVATDSSCEVESISTLFDSIFSSFNSLYNP